MTTSPTHFEAESIDRGANWLILDDSNASGGEYVSIKDGLNSPQAVPLDKEGFLRIPFSVSENATFYLFARANCPSADDDSFWIKFDNRNDVAANGLGTKGWEWVKLSKVELEPGEHTLKIAYREDGASLDKISITTYPFGPSESETD